MKKEKYSISSVRKNVWLEFAPLLHPSSWCGCVTVGVWFAMVRNVVEWTDILEYFAHKESVSYACCAYWVQAFTIAIFARMNVILIDGMFSWKKKLTDFILQLHYIALHCNVHNNYSVTDTSVLYSYYEFWHVQPHNISDLGTTKDHCNCKGVFVRARVVCVYYTDDKGFRTRDKSTLWNEWTEPVF